jgi:hypothetical protein
MSSSQGLPAFTGEKLRAPKAFVTTIRFPAASVQHREQAPAILAHDGPQPFDHLCEFGAQAVRLSAVTALATGQSGKAIVPVLGAPVLYGPQRKAMMASHMGQRHVVFNAGLGNAVSRQGWRSLLGRSRRQWQGSWGWWISQRGTWVSTGVTLALWPEHSILHGLQS